MCKFNSLNEDVLEADRLVFFRGITYGLPGLVHLSDAEVLQRNDPARFFILETHRRDKRRHIFSSFTRIQTQPACI